MSGLTALGRRATALAARMRAVGRHRGRASLGVIVPLVVALAVGLDPTVRDELLGGIAGGDGDQSQLFARRTRTTPSPTTRPELQVIAIAAGTHHSLAIKSDGSVWGWGNNTYGQLGDGTLVWRSEPTRVHGIREATAIAAGAHHSLAVTRDGSVWAWGRNDGGQLGDGTTALRKEPVRVAGIGAAAGIAAGDAFSLAVTRDGSVWAWGTNTSGQLGDGTRNDRSRPVRTSGISGVDRVAAGARHALALRADGTVWSWGLNQEGQLGDRTLETRAEPVQVANLSGVIAVAAGGSTSVSLTGDGRVQDWGRGTHFRDRPTFNNSANAREIDGIARGIDATIVVRRDGTVWTWRANGDNEMQVPGLQLTQAAQALTRAGGRLSVRAAVAAGGHHAMGLGDDGKVWAWGQNSSGQIGDGSTAERTAPVLLTSLAR